MGSVRVVQTILGYILPYVLLFTLLFMLEWFIELILGLFAAILNNTLNSGFDETPNFFGPTDVLHAAFGYFPSIWDLGTGIFYGGLGAGTYLIYVMVAILDGFAAITLFGHLKDNLYAVSTDAINRSAAKFGALPSGFVPNSSGINDPTSADYEFWNTSEVDLDHDGVPDADEDDYGGPN